MTNERLQNIRASAINHAAQYGLSIQECEDFAQEATFQIYDNPKRDVGFLFIDYMRSQFGRPNRSKNAEAKRASKLAYGDVDMAEQTDPTAFSYDSKFDLDFSKYQSILASDERAILTLFFKWELTMAEIGECFGLSEGRVSQKMSEIKAKILRRVLKKDMASV